MHFLLLAPPKKPHLPPPHFASKAVKNLVQSMLKAEANLKPVAIHVVGDDGNVLIYWNRGRIRQEGGKSVWVYGNHRFAESCEKGFFQGRASRADVLDYVAYLSGGADTLSRELMYKAPFNDFIESGAKISLSGTIQLDGRSTDIVHINGSLFKGAIYVRRSDFLVVGADIESLGGTGAVIERGHRRYSYKPLPGDSSKLFVLTARHGVATQPLPKEERILPGGKKMDSKM